MDNLIKSLPSLIDDFPLDDPLWRSVGQHLLQCMTLLLSAQALAQDAAGDPHDFAVSERELQTVGATRGEIQWLVCKRLVDTWPVSAEEVSGNGGDLFWITARGQQFAHQLLSRATNHHALILDASPPNSTVVGVKPHWIAERRELWLGTALIKAYRVPAANQEWILASFEEEGWPQRIDDPLPPANGIAPRERLRACVRALNRNRKSRLLWFTRDGTGHGIGWQHSLACSPSHPS